MKIKKLSTVFLCAALCASLMSGCEERKSTPLSVNSDENTVSSLLTDESSSDVSSDISDASTDNSDTSDTSNETSADNTASSGEKSSTAPTDATPVQSSSPTQNDDPQQTAESSSSEHRHQYTVTKTVEPNCSEVGYKIHTCSCGDQYTETTSEPLGHNYLSTSVDSPTCDHGGHTTYTCSRCGQSHHDDHTTALGHKYTSKTVKATCTEKGYTLNTCSRCGHEYKSDNTSALGHSWSEWTVTKSATTSSEGVKTSECTRCGETKKESIPKLKADSNSSSYVSEVVRLVNVERAKYGLSPLTMRSDLNEYAQLRCTEIVSNFNHVRPDGANPLDHVLALSGIHTAGENIAWRQKTPEAVMTAWMNSTGHRANILNTGYTSIGVGCYEYGGKLYWTQIFAG